MDRKRAPSLERQCVPNHGSHASAPSAALWPAAKDCVGGCAEPTLEGLHRRPQRGDQGDVAGRPLEHDSPCSYHSYRSPSATRSRSGGSSIFAHRARSGSGCCAIQCDEQASNTWSPETRRPKSATSAGASAPASSRSSLRWSRTPSPTSVATPSRSSAFLAVRDHLDVQRVGTAVGVAVLNQGAPPPAASGSTAGSTGERSLPGG